MSLCFQILVPEEKTRDTSTQAVTLEAKAEKSFVLPHERASSKPKYEGFKSSEEVAKEINIASEDQVSGQPAIHREIQSRAVRKETQTGVGS
jgi:hypothetical protein